MTGRRVALVFLWHLLGCTVAGRADAEDAAELLEKISSARCTSRCLALHMTQLTASFRHLQNDGVLSWCENHRRCSQCLQPCRELWEAKRTLSQKSCEKHYECMTSLEFLTSVQAHRQGDCPPPQRASGFAAACVESCGMDRDCSAPRKCCSNDCGHTCQAPNNLYKGVPLRPRRDMSFVEDTLGQLEVMWTSRFNVSIEPVLYILQRRWNLGVHPNEEEATPWETVLMTMANRAVLRDVRPHRWYQFRVSAVNSQGTRGFTTPSKHFLSSRDPLPPAMPWNLRQGKASVQVDGSVNMHLLWDPPREGELTVHHHRVTWSSHTPHRVGLDRKGSPIVTGPAVCETTLEHLQANTSYLVQVQAIAYWGQKRLRSKKAHLSIITPPTDAANRIRPVRLFSSLLPSMLHRAVMARVGGTRREVSNELSSSHSTPIILRLQAAAPHIHRHQLQVKVFWKTPQGSLQDSTAYLLRWYPEVCTHNLTKTEKTATVQGTHYVITGLLFGCKYRVSVMPTSGHGKRSKATTYLITPQCRALEGREAKSLSCLRSERHHMAKKENLRPEKLTVAFQMVNGSLQGKFGWQVSQRAIGLGSITGFQFSWALVSSSSMASSDTLISQTQILAPDQFSMTVEHLQPDSTYKVQVQVLSAGGGGAAVVKTVHTPQPNHTLL
ncbi:anosmin-1-like isoform X2 [Megalops cyprinoides]|uniref:anosmin-1-like isoform X2 n=1 Tax=Megalops cyprinoides TaxID=118141 RepID=UPI001863A4D2|nr:anosmin-1-like isoform X2 [Megalops cyprinoides]